MGGLFKNKEEEDLLDAYISTSVDEINVYVSVYVRAFPFMLPLLIKSSFITW